MPHPFAANPAVRNFHAAAVADYSLVLCPLVLAARAFPVPLRPEYPFAEKPVLLRPVRPVVDCLGLANLAE